ncbi:hypothetical protein MAQ58_10970 [Enterobacter sp. DRP3]|nr:hypothetical protein [Enterobacter sp. DRP3]
MFNKIAYVNLVRVLNESTIGQSELARLQEVKEILTNAEQAAQEAYLGMSDEEKERNRAADIANINQSWGIEQQNARAASIRAILKEVEDYRNSNELGMILNSEYVIAAEQQYDVTDDIILHVKDIAVEYGDLPSFTVTRKENSNEEKETEA